MLSPPGLLVVMSLESDVDSFSDASSLIVVARFKETSSSRMAFLALKFVFCSPKLMTLPKKDATKNTPKVAEGVTKSRPPSVIYQ